MHLVFFSFLFLLSCTQTPLPVLRIPNDTLVMRESFQEPGPERTGNWRGRFDTRGCWWEAHNTWLVVTDQVLLSSPAYPLHWNAVEPEKPWFCLTARQLAGLRRAVEAVKPVPAVGVYSEAVDRWIVVRDDGIHAVVKARGHQEGEWEALTEYFDLLSSVHVWGQSPEQS